VFFEDEQNRFVLVTNEDISKRTAVGVKLEEIEDDFEKIEDNYFKRFIYNNGYHLSIYSIKCFTNRINCSLC